METISHSLPEASREPRDRHGKSLSKFCFACEQCSVGGSIESLSMPSLAVGSLEFFCPWMNQSYLGQRTLAGPTPPPSRGDDRRIWSPLPSGRLNTVESTVSRLVERAVFLPVVVVVVQAAGWWCCCNLIQGERMHGLSFPLQLLLGLAAQLREQQMPKCRVWLGKAAKS